MAEKAGSGIAVMQYDKITYQQLINNYAQHHERQTTMDFSSSG